MKKNLWDWIASALSPGYWLMLEKLSPRWDAKLIRLLDEHKFTDYDGGHTAKLGDFTIWVANHPYSSFMPWAMEGLPEKVRARRSTIHYAMRRFRADVHIDGDPYPAESKEVAELRKMWGAK